MAESPSHVSNELGILSARMRKLLESELTTLRRLACDRPCA